VGREALQAQKDAGLSRRLRGFRLQARGFPRPGHEVVIGGEVVGPVRSGTVSPTLDAGIGTAYLPPDVGFGDEIGIRIRGKEHAAVVERMPFYHDGSVRK
jgi:aminomethyltransferase